MTIGALALVFFAFWAFVRLEIHAPNTTVFIAECVFFLFIYALTLFNMPLIIPTLLLIAGCVAKAVINMQFEGARELDFLFPVTYLLAFLFYIEQLYRVRCEEKTVLANVLGWAFRVISVAFLGFTVYYVLENGVKVSWTHTYSIFIFVIIGLIYLAVGLMKSGHVSDQKKKNKKKKEKEKARMTYPSMRMSFVFVPVCTLGSCLLFIKNPEYCLVHAVPVLWAVNIIMLISQGHPLVSARYESVRSKMDAWTKK